MLIRETDKVFIIRKNIISILLFLGLAMTFMALAVTIYNTPKELRNGLNYRLKKMDSDIRHDFDDRDNLQDIEISRHEEMLYDLSHKR